MTEERLRRLHAIVATLPLLAWGAFHVVEQWALFGGRLAWLVRMRTTSSGAAIALEVLIGVLPIVLWALLHARARLVGERLPGASRDGDGALARGLGAIEPWASPVAIGFLLWHVGWLWGAKLLGAQPVELYDTLQRTLGLPWALVVHAIGLTAIAWHLAAALPDGLEAARLVRTAPGRRSAYVVSVAFGACLLVLYAQLVGWIGTGAGTFWPITVVPR